jgi:hypothetical protein
MGYPRLTTTSSLDRLFIQFLKNLRTADTAALRHYRTFDLLFESDRRRRIVDRHFVTIPEDG